MSDLEYLKQYQKIKDISDVISDIEKLDWLVYQNDWQAVNQHLGDISQKYPIEKSIWPGRKFCVSGNRQSQEWRGENRVGVG